MHPETPGTYQPPFRSLPLAQREVALIIVLCVISAATFEGTRRLATWSRDRRAQAAAQWFARGEQLANAGDLAGSTAALREAVAANRQNPHYSLALARSLGDAGRNDEARQLLLQLRQGEPDDVEINYRLARLAGLSSDTSDAIRYYNYAIYGLARIGADRDRSAIRSELITFLLAGGERQEAATELGALARELPDAPGAHLEAGRLADKAGDAKVAFDQYRRAARLDPTNAEAAVGAGEAAFALRDFAATVRELERAGELGAIGSGVSSHLATARLVLGNDPLAPRIPTRERTRRVLAGLAHAAERYAGCAGAMQSVTVGTDLTRSEIDRLRRQGASAFQDPDLLSHAIRLIGTAEATLQTRCPTSAEPIDQAWELIAATHQGTGA